MDDKSKLTAFVLGELDPAEARELVRRMETDEGLRREVEALSALNAKVSAHYGVETEDGADFQLSSDQLERIRKAAHRAGRERGWLTGFIWGGAIVATCSIALMMFRQASLENSESRQARIGGMASAPKAELREEKRKEAVADVNMPAGASGGGAGYGMADEGAVPPPPAAPQVKESAPAPALADKKLSAEPPVPQAAAGAAIKTGKPAPAPRAKEKLGLLSGFAAKRDGRGKGSQLDKPSANAVTAPSDDGVADAMESESDSAVAANEPAEMQSMEGAPAAALDLAQEELPQVYAVELDRAHTKAPAASLDTLAGQVQNINCLPKNAKLPESLTLQIKTSGKTRTLNVEPQVSEAVKTCIKSRLRYLPAVPGGVQTIVIKLK